jgi:hypothetical protein
MSIILETYLTKSMENSSSSHLFISQIDILFNNQNLREFYISSSSKMKRLNLMKIIIHKFTNNYESKYSVDLNECRIEYPRDKNVTTLFQMKFENAINLIKSVRSFIFSSCNYQIENEENAFCDLVDFLTEGMDDK